MYQVDYQPLLWYCAYVLMAISHDINNYTVKKLLVVWQYVSWLVISQSDSTWIVEAQDISVLRYDTL